MAKWIDLNMLMAEIDLHRSNCDRVIKAYKEKEKPTPFEIAGYNRAIGAIVRLSCIKQWCQDFAFDNADVVKFINDEQL